MCKNSDQKLYENTKNRTKENGDKKFVIISECKSEKQSPKKHHKSCRKSIFSKSTGFLVEEQKKASRGKFTEVLKSLNRSLYSG